MDKDPLMMDAINYTVGGSVFSHPVPTESYSRTLDQRVWGMEMPYGYTGNPPPADTQDFDQARIESKKQYPRKGGRAI